MSRPRAASIAEIKARHSIVEVLEQLGIHPPGRWNGSGDFMINCPCHDDSTPSCVIHPDTDWYHCFGCGVHGDVIQLIQDTGRAGSVWEALAFLDGQIVVSASPPRARQTGPTVGCRTSLERVLEVNEAAWIVLTDGTAVRRAERYLVSRGIDVDALHRLTSEPLVGYTPAARDGLTRVLRSSGFSEDEVLDAGWALRLKATLVDRFHHRVVFPIRDEGRRLLGVTARDLTGRAKAKYINTPSTPAFRKGETLYRPLPCSGGATRVVVVEGPLDALAVTASATKRSSELQMAQAVALCGTAMSSHQASMIAHLGSGSVTTMADGDAAGREATRSWSDSLRRVDCEVGVVRLPAGDDPTSLLIDAEHTAQALDLE